MKIAVLADIHNNIEALRAAYEAVHSSGVDKIYHPGDTGGYAPFVLEIYNQFLPGYLNGSDSTLHLFNNEFTPYSLNRASCSLL